MVDLTMGASAALKDLTGQRNRLTFDIVVVTSVAGALASFLLSTIIFWPWGLGFSLAALIIGFSVSQPLVAIYYLRNLDDLIQAGLISLSGESPHIGRLSAWLIKKSMPALRKGVVGKLIAAATRVFSFWVWVALIFSIAAAIVTPLLGLIVDDWVGLFTLLIILLVAINFYIRETYDAWSFIRTQKKRAGVKRFSKVLKLT